MDCVAKRPSLELTNVGLKKLEMSHKTWEMWMRLWSLVIVGTNAIFDVNCWPYNLTAH